MPPLQQAEAPAELTALQRWSQEQGFVLGVNINPMPVIKFGGSLDRLIAAHVKAIDRLAASVPGLAVALLPHDVRSGNDDVSAARALGDAVSGRCPVFDGLVKREISAHLMKSAAGCCHAVFSGRMHLAIGALGMGVPVAGIDYLDKFDGLMDHFGIEDLMVPIDDACNADRLGTVMHELCREVVPLTARVQAALPKVRALAERNFEGFPSAVEDKQVVHA